jgi:hypothetical protein
MNIRRHKLNKLCEFKKLFKKEEWIFRGGIIKSGKKENGSNKYYDVKKISKHLVESTLDKKIKEWKLERKRFSKNIKCLELELLRDFQRRYIISGGPAPPPRNDIIAWFSLMRHYGAPSRFLDFTYSPYLALFFGLSKVDYNRIKSNSVEILAIKRDWFDDALPVKKYGRRIKLLINRIKANDYQAFKELFIIGSDEKNDFVYPVIPYDLNQRITIQQGLFLCPTNVGETFKSNFIKMIENTGKEKNGEIFTITIQVDSTDMIKELFYEIYRMNIYSATIYPGLEGYAQSYSTRLPFLHDIAKAHNWDFYKNYVEKL